MIFNSIQYGLFLPIVFILYWFVFGYAMSRCKRQTLLQNIFLVLISYVFYAWWNWRFLGLLVGMSLLSWLTVQYMHRNNNRRKLMMWIAIVTDVTILGFFKYFNFFVISFCNHLSSFG